MPNETIKTAQQILDSGMYAGFAAFVHYLYMYQRGGIKFRLTSLLIAVILGIFCGNIVDAIIPEDFSYQLWMLTINKTAISFMAGFMYKFVLDSIEKYQTSILNWFIKSHTPQKNNKKK